MFVCDAGIPVSLLLNATDLELPGRISRVEFIDLHGDVLTEIPTQLYDTRPALYNVSNIVSPSDFFYIKVCLLTFHSCSCNYRVHNNDSTASFKHFDNKSANLVC